MARTPRGLSPVSTEASSTPADSSIAAAFTSGAIRGAVGTVQARQVAGPARSEAPAEQPPVEEPAPTEVDPAPVGEEATQAAPIEEGVPPVKPEISAYRRAREQLDQKLEARGLNGPTRTQEIDFSR